MMGTRDQRLRQRLEEAFNPQELLLKDQSQLHIGHEGARDGKGHFDVTIVSTMFVNVNRVRRHRMIYEALRDLIESDIHALRIKAYTPAERDRSA
jgi:stress-induced morphogen